MVVKGFVCGKKTVGNIAVGDGVINKGIEISGGYRHEQVCGCFQLHLLIGRGVKIASGNLQLQILLSGFGGNAAGFNLLVCRKPGVGGSCKG